MNQQFRRDIFVKGARRLSSLEQGEAMREQAFVLAPMPGEGPIAIRNARMEEKVWQPVVKVLREENGKWRAQDVARTCRASHAQGHASGEGHGVRRTRAARQAPHRPRYRLSMCRCWVGGIRQLQRGGAAGANSMAAAR